MSNSKIRSSKSTVPLPSWRSPPRSWRRLRRRAVRVMQESHELAQASLRQAQATAAALAAVTGSVATINQMNIQVATAAEQQRVTTGDMNRSITRIRDVAEQTASSAEQTTRARAELAPIAMQLQSLGGRIKVHGR